MQLINSYIVLSIRIQYKYFKKSTWSLNGMLIEAIVV